LTVVHASLKVPPPEMWSELKPVNREFVLRQVEGGNWDLAVDIARLSLATIRNTSTNDLLIQEALHEFNSTIVEIKEQILEAIRSSTVEYGQSILADVNRHLGIVHQRLEAISRESAAVGPALKETLATLDGSASAVAAVLASLKLPGAKGEIGEISVLDGLRTAFLGIPSVSIEPFGAAGETDAVIHFELNGIELAKVLVESKNRVAWSNAFLTQLERDMTQLRAHFGILVTTALPKNAKSRGYAVAERGGIIVITTPELASAIALVLYDLIRSLDRLTIKGQTLQALLRSRELLECLTSNLSLVTPLGGVIKIMDKAHNDVTSNINQIIEAIRRNNSKLIEKITAEKPANEIIVPGGNATEISEVTAEATH
jgi:hypothetical protein